MREIPYSDINTQITKLKNKGLHFNDLDHAKNMMSIYGYYNIINTYKEPYIHIENGEKVYNAGVSFEQIFSLFTFDHTLRNSVLSSMLEKFR